MSASGKKELEADYWSYFIVPWEPQVKGPKGGEEESCLQLPAFALHALRKTERSVMQKKDTGIVVDVHSLFPG